MSAPRGAGLRSRRLSRAEAALWHHAMREVAPMPGRAETAEPMVEPAPKPVTSPPPPVVPPTPRVPASPVAAMPSPPAPLRLGVAHGLDRRNADRLRRGEKPIDGRLDLHGMNQAEAHVALNGYLVQCHDQGKRCILVITGKGPRPDGGVLRNAVPRWLNDPALRARVLAITPAQPRDGGEGALYVLLKRHR